MEKETIKKDLKNDIKNNQEESKKKKNLKKDTFIFPIYVFGRCSWGRLGIGPSPAITNTPKPIDSLKGQHVMMAVCGAGHSYAIVQSEFGNPQSNIVYSWGKCNFGQLGHAQLEEDQYSPVQIMALNNLSVISLGAGDSYGLAVTLSGDIYSWGCGFGGTLGHGNEQHSAVPKKIMQLDGVKMIQVAGGKNHSLALSQNGECYAWGTNKNGQLGLGTTTTKYNPTKIAFFDTKKIIKIACGNHHSLCLTEEGIVYAFGLNHQGQIGLPVPEVPQSPLPVLLKLENSIIDIGCSLNFSWAIDNEKQLWMWGDNTGGQLAQLDMAFNPIPKLVLKEDGKPIMAEKVCGTQYATICITLDNKIYRWGDVFLWQDQLGTVTRRPENCQPKILSLNARPIFLGCGCNHVVIVAAIN